MRDIHLRGDAAASLADLIAGPVRPARILGAFPAAVYLAPARGRVVGIEAADGVGLPNAVILHTPSVGLDLAGTSVDAEACIGGGMVRAGALVVAVDTWIDRRLAVDGLAPVPARLDAFEQLIATDAPALHGPLAAAVADLTASLTPSVASQQEPPPSFAPEAALAMLGLGDGLTPSGDDVCCGLLAGGRTVARAMGATGLDDRFHDLGGALAAAAATRTTALSAALLWHAARGELARPARHVLRALFGQTPLEPALRALLAVGHSSGRDLAVGLAIGARLAVSWPAAQPITLNGAIA